MAIFAHEIINQNVMKKALLLLFVSIIAVGTMAQGLKEGQFLVGLYTSDDYGKFGVGFGMENELEAGTRVPVSCWAGMDNLTVDGVRFALAESVKIKSVKLYAMKAGNTIVGPLATKTVNKNCSVGWNTVMLDKPVAVADDYQYLIPMYVFDCTMESYVIATSFAPKEGTRSLVLYGPLRTDTTEPVWGNLNGDKYGSAAVQLICTSAAISGSTVVADGYESRTVLQGGQFDATIGVSCTSDEPVESVDYSVTLGGKTVSGTATFATPLDAGYNIKGAFTCSLTAPEKAGAHTVEVKFTKVNGKALKEEGKATYRQNVVLREARRMSLVEEFTGTACGWCSRGWVGMEKVKKELADKACVVALHQYDEADPMYGDYYHRPSFIGGAPKAVVDRSVRSTDPYYGDKVEGKDEGIIKTVERYADLLPEVEISELSATWADVDKMKIDATAATEFLTDLPGSQLVFVLTADGLTGGGRLWQQTNFYGSVDAKENGVTQENDPELYKLCRGQEMGQTYVTLVYNDVMIGSSWASPEADNGVAAFSATGVGEKSVSTYTLELPAKAVLLNAIKKDEVYVTAMVIKADGTIANAGRCKVTDTEGTSPITLQTPNSLRESFAYDLCGRKVKVSTPGVKIVNGKKIISDKNFF